jgi:hypothetical protein
MCPFLPACLLPAKTGQLTFYIDDDLAGFDKLLLQICQTFIGSLRRKTEFLPPARLVQGSPGVKSPLDLCFTALLKN